MKAAEEKETDIDRDGHLMVRERVRELLYAGARMIGIVVREREDGALELIYIFDRGGRIASFRFAALPEWEIDSVADLFPGALTAEREAVDLFGVKFKGVQPGLFLVEGRSPVTPLRRSRHETMGVDADG